MLDKGYGHAEETGDLQPAPQKQLMRAVASFSEVATWPDMAS